MKGAIIIPVYKRTISLKRLLNSVESADIKGDVSIVFSLDKNYDNKVLEILNNFEWHYGEKKIVYNNYKNGVDGNNLNCFYQGLDYDYFVLLEDDYFVHTNFHHFIIDSLQFYSSCNHGIAGFSLYRFERSEDTLTPHYVPNNGNFTFFLQKASSRGSFYRKVDIQKFINFLEKGILDIEIPMQVQQWGNQNWEVIFMKYLVYSNQYFVYPRYSFSLPFCEVGVHFKRKSDLLGYASEMVWLYYKEKFTLEPFENSLLKYDTSFKITKEWYRFYNYNSDSISAEMPLIPTELNAVYPELNSSTNSILNSKLISKERQRFFQITYKISFKELFALFIIKVIDFLKSKLPH